MSQTRYSKETGIEYKKFDCIAHCFWQHIDISEGRGYQVGPQYRTKIELLQDHEGYLIRAGWLKVSKRKEEYLTNEQN